MLRPMAARPMAVAVAAAAKVAAVMGVSIQCSSF